MPENFQYDVFLSHSSKDKPIVRPLAERLRGNGLRVWFDEWEMRAGDHILSRIEHGLERSRVLVLCMSAHAFGSDWAQLESGTFRFRDPLNKDRRFVPLRLDESPIKGALAQFLYINWLPEDREQEYPKLLQACRSPMEMQNVETGGMSEPLVEMSVRLETNSEFVSCVFSKDRKRILSSCYDKSVRLWEVETGRCLREFESNAQLTRSLAWSPDQRYVLSCLSHDSGVYQWDFETGAGIRKLEGHADAVHSVEWSPNSRLALSGSYDMTVRVWNVETGRCPRVFEGHRAAIDSLAWSTDQRLALSGARDHTVRLWEVETGACLRVFEGHTDVIWSVAWSADQRRALSSGADKTVRLWDVDTGRCLRVLEGHTRDVASLALNPTNQYRVLSGSTDKTVRLWDLESGRCLRVLKGHVNEAKAVVWSEDQSRAFSCDSLGQIYLWDLSQFVTESHTLEVARPSWKHGTDQVQYTNAKVLIVGESGVGKTGLSRRLAFNEWQPSDSTVGAWATQWKLPVSSASGVNREIWLWDFGGQADQRLIHQLYMEDTSLAVLVFDGQKENLFETLGQWDRDITRASRKPFAKMLVAGRVDAGGLRVSRNHVETFAKERGFARYLETSAKFGVGCQELKEAIIAGIRWNDIPWRSSPLLFKRLKEEIIRLKDEGRVLMRFNELRDALRLRLSAGAEHFEHEQFKDEELKAVVGLLAGPGVVWELAFGSWVLLQPERINAYAQAVIQTVRADEGERGAITEERVLAGNFVYQSSMQRLEPSEERFVLLAMHQTLVERGLCLREQTDTGPLLIFPSYYRRERPELEGHPAVLVSYRFSGFLDDIYATLVVRLHHIKPFQPDKLWRYAADFKTLTDRQLGLKLTRRAEGAGELEVYFDQAIPVEEKIIFSRYIQDHLQQKGLNTVRLRHYVCPHCGTPVGNREVAMRRLDEWLKRTAEKEAGGWIKGLLVKTPTIICSNCEERVELWDDLEQIFASRGMRERVRQLQDQTTVVLDNESKERALIGEVISTVTLAGQITREFNIDDHGIGMEIEFRDDDGAATGQKLYLVLKSEPYEIRDTQRAQIVTIEDESHIRYWMEQPFPLMLVIRNSRKEVRWMDLRAWLKRTQSKSHSEMKHIDFEGKRFDVMSVRRWRDKILGGSSTVDPGRV